MVFQSYRTVVKYLSLDTLKGVCIGDEKLFLIQGDSPQSFNWEQFGLKITFPEGTLSPKDTSEVAVRALVGGQFQFPKGTELISAVHGISVSKPLLKSVKLEIQHCADLVVEDHTNYLSFATASVNSELPYQFELEEGGLFHSNDQYGSIYLSHFCLKAIVKFIKILFGCPSSSGLSSDDEYVDALEPPTQVYGNEVSPSKNMLNTKTCYFTYFLFIGNSPVVSSCFISMDGLKLLASSSPTDDISTSSLENSPQLQYSSSLPNKQSQTKGRPSVLTILIPIFLSR